MATSSLPAATSSAQSPQLRAAAERGQKRRVRRRRAVGADDDRAGVDAEADAPAGPTSCTVYGPLSAHRVWLVWPRATTSIARPARVFRDRMHHSGAGVWQHRGKCGARRGVAALTRRRMLWFWIARGRAAPTGAAFRSGTRQLRSEMRDGPRVVRPAGRGGRNGSGGRRAESRAVRRLPSPHVPAGEWSRSRGSRGVRPGWCAPGRAPR